MTTEEANILKNKILCDNKILYCMKNRPCNETTMCWGLEINNGWIEVIDDMSKKLEALNCIFYPKFRVRVQMDQLKEKFGLLTVYYSIISDPPRWMHIWHSLFQKLFDKISNIDFKKLEVLDHDDYDETVEEEIASKEAFEKEKKTTKNCSNVELLERDGKFIRKATYHRCRQTHWIPTKHKMLFKILMNRHKIENLPMILFNVEPTYRQLCISELIEDKAKSIIKKAEDACYNTCEICGHHISDDNGYSPRCTMQGWIQYLCKECADKSGNNYVMDGAIWQNGKEIISKEERDRQIAEMNKRFKLDEGDET